MGGMGKGKGCKDQELCLREEALSRNLSKKKYSVAALITVYKPVRSGRDQGVVFQRVNAKSWRKCSRWM